MCGARRPHRHCRQPLTPSHQNASIKNVYGMNDKEKAALGSIAASAGLTAAKAIVGCHDRLARHPVGSRPFADRPRRDGADLFRRARLRQAGRRRTPIRPRQDRKRHRARRNGAAFRARRQSSSGRRRSGSSARKPMRSRRRPAAFAVIAVSIVVDFFRARTLERVAEQTSSEALEADALHFCSDMWSSIAVLCRAWRRRARLCVGRLGGRAVVAVFICIAGWRLGRRTIDTLTDTAPAGVSEKRGRDRAARAGRRRGRAGARAAGRRGAVRRSRRRRQPHAAARSRDRDQGAARRAPSAPNCPTAEVTITTEPRALDDETVRERVMVIARNRGLAVHHVAVQAIARPAVGLRSILKSTARCRFRAAHEIASAARRGDPRGARRRMSRSKPISSRCRPSCLPAAMRRRHGVAEVRDALAALAAGSPDLGEVHDVRVRETADGEIVNFHCQRRPGARRCARCTTLVDGARARTAPALSDHRAGHRPRRAERWRSRGLRNNTAAPCSRPSRRSASAYVRLHRADSASPAS